jgi:hypothetical protein
MIDEHIQEGKIRLAMQGDLDGVSKTQGSDSALALPPHRGLNFHWQVIRKRMVD